MWYKWFRQLLCSSMRCQQLQSSSTRALDSIWMTACLFCFRLLQFPQTLLGLELSFTKGVYEKTFKKFHLLPVSPLFVIQWYSWACLCCRVCLPWLSSDIVSSAKFVLIVEKDATFQRLLDDDFCTKLRPCIIITVSFICSHNILGIFVNMTLFLLFGFLFSPREQNQDVPWTY